MQHNQTNQTICFLALEERKGKNAESIDFTGFSMKGNKSNKKIEK